jgi:hypothetical protein
MFAHFIPAGEWRSDRKASAIAALIQFPQPAAGDLIFYPQLGAVRISTTARQTVLMSSLLQLLVLRGSITAIQSPH